MVFLNLTWHGTLITLPGEGHSGKGLPYLQQIRITGQSIDQRVGHSLSVRYLDDISSIAYRDVHWRPVFLLIGETRGERDVRDKHEWSLVPRFSLLPVPTLSVTFLYNSVVYRISASSLTHCSVAMNISRAYLKDQIKRAQVHNKYCRM